jgi:hypothetical protein
MRNHAQSHVYTRKAHAHAMGLQVGAQVTWRRLGHCGQHRSKALHVQHWRSSAASLHAGIIACAACRTEGGTGCKQASKQWIKQQHTQRLGLHTHRCMHSTAHHGSSNTAIAKLHAATRTTRWLLLLLLLLVCIARNHTRPTHRHQPSSSCDRAHAACMFVCRKNPSLPTHRHKQGRHGCVHKNAVPRSPPPLHNPGPSAGGRQPAKTARKNKRHTLRWPQRHQHPPPSPHWARCGTSTQAPSAALFHGLSVTTPCQVNPPCHALSTPCSAYARSRPCLSCA